MKTLLLLALVLGQYVVSSQQVFVKKWDKTYGGTADDPFNTFQQTKDNGYIIGGYSNSGISGDRTEDTRGSYDCWIVKTDSSGNKQWDKRFGSAGYDILDKIRQTKDGGYILGGATGGGIGGDKTEGTRGSWDYWVVKTDSTGNKQWDKRFGGANNDQLWDVLQTADGGYILCGYSYSGISGDKTQDNWDTTEHWGDGWVVKIDAAGNKQWDKRYGGTESDVITCIYQTTDGGYLLGGSTSSDSSSGDVTTLGWGGGGDFWLIRIDSIGNKLWEKKYGGTGPDQIIMIQGAYDGSYILGGYSGSPADGDKTTGGGPYWIVKVDSTGNKEWDNAFGNAEACLAVCQTADSGYIVSGSSTSNAGEDKTENNLGYGQIWIVKTNSMGQKQWDKTIFTTKTNYGYAIQSNDGCYVAAAGATGGIGGYKTEPNRDTSNQTYDYWIMKFCMEEGTGFDDGLQTTDYSTIQVYPNPFTTDISISIQKENLKQADFSISNMLGQTVYTKQETGLSNNYTKMLDLSYLPNSIYVVQVVVDGERVERKIIKNNP